ncbi:MAG: hypothetical protein M3Z92_05040 [Bacteroidota bacterium]|nr:hypothetical protein [Bacteroidota bacterium]
MDILQNNKPGKRLQGLLSIDYWNRLLLVLYVVTMPFVSAFAFTGTISVPLILAVFLFLLMGIKILNDGKFPEGFLGFDIVIIIFLLFIVVFTFLINGWGNSKSFNHTVGYLSTFLLFHVTIKFAFFAIKDKALILRKVLQYLTYITIFSAIFANIEFFLSNVLDININDYIPRPSEVEAFYDATVLGLFYRARGFAPESGHFAFMMELFFPLTIYYIYFTGLCKWNKFLKAISIIVIILSFIFTVSTASFVIVPVAFLLASVVYAKRIFFYINRYIVKFFIGTIITFTVALLLNYLFSFSNLIFLSITDKLESGSFDDRQERINFFYDQFSRLNIIKQISGVGPAGYDILGFDEVNSILSLYHNITFELGFFGLFLLFSLFVYIIIVSLNIKDKIGFFLLAALISGVLHFYFIANFWYPWFWFITAFTVFYKKNF